MWVFLTRRFRRWLILAIAVPVLGAVARRLSERIEKKHAGPTKTSKALGHAGRFAQSTRRKRR